MRCTMQEGELKCNVQRRKVSSGEEENTELPREKSRRAYLTDVPPTITNHDDNVDIMEHMNCKTVTFSINRG